MFEYSYIDCKGQRVREEQKVTRTTHLKDGHLVVECERSEVGHLAERAHNAAHCELRVGEVLLEAARRVRQRLRLSDARHRQRDCERAVQRRERRVVLGVRQLRHRRRHARHLHMRDTSL